MACGSCSRSGRKPSTTSYELTKPDGTVSEHGTLVEARMQRSLAGGGTIRTIREPATT